MERIIQENKVLDISDGGRKLRWYLPDQAGMIKNPAGQTADIFLHFGKLRHGKDLHGRKRLPAEDQLCHFRGGTCRRKNLNGKLCQRIFQHIPVNAFRGIQSGKILIQDLLRQRAIKRSDAGQQLFLFGRRKHGGRLSGVTGRFP